MSVTDGWPLDRGKDADLLLAAQFAFLPLEPKRIGVAVSGGGDSIALLHLLHRAAPHAGWQVQAVTVDHGLRDASATEAQGVADFCAGLGILHTTLIWDHGAISGNVMDVARKARMRLISEWAQQQNIMHVAIGHTADDRAETFLMGLARSSGLDGLAGMRFRWRDHGIQWDRPLLNHSRAELRSYLRRHGVQWVDDPTNDDEAFTRIKARKALVALAPLGITIKSLKTTINHLSMVRDALQETLQAVVAAHVTETAGALQISYAEFRAMPREVQRRFLQAAIAWFSHDEYPPRMTKQDNLGQYMRAGWDATLNGCRFQSDGKIIRIAREAKAASKIEVPTTAPWDNRWHLDGPHAPGLTIRALGDGIRACPDWRATGIPRDALVVSPAIWRGDVLIAAPLAGFAQGWTATLRPHFVSFLLSH
ncbi:MAG: tRNA lysidine(34) synthetase TilS [Pseudomonadota bacterium]